MRHYLLASAALLGLTAGMAQAATLSTESYTDKGPAGSTPNFASVGPSVQTSPDPGKMTVRMGGWVMTAIGAMGGNVANGTSTFTGTAGGVATTSTAPAGTQKVKTNPYGFDSFAYLYFGVDGRTINNLLYGALVEVRNNNQLGVGALTPGSTTVTQGTQTVASSSTNSTNAFLYVRRAYTYFGADKLGIFRLGSGDDPNSIFLGQTTGETYSRNGWDGDASNFVYTNAKLNWVFATNGATYTTNRLTWISPTFFGPTGVTPTGNFNGQTGNNGNPGAPGLNFGLSFAPSSSTTNNTQNANAGIGQNPAQLTSVVTGDAARADNIYEVAAKYSGAAGPVGYYGLIAYTGSGAVGYVGSAPVAFGSGGYGGAAGGNATNYYGLSIIDAGATLSYMGATVYGHLTTGKMNGPSTTEPKTPHSKNGIGYVVGPQYGIGPVTFGGQFYVFESTGSASTSSTVGPREERGFSVGGRYTLEPGVFFASDYVYGTRHERGVNFVDSSTGAPTNVGNNTIAQAIDVSFNVQW